MEDILTNVVFFLFLIEEYPYAMCFHS